MGFEWDSGEHDMDSNGFQILRGRLDGCFLNARSLQRYFREIPGGV